MCIRIHVNRKRHVALYGRKGRGKPGTQEGIPGAQRSKLRGKKSMFFFRIGGPEMGTWKYYFQESV